MQTDNAIIKKQIWRYNLQQLIKVWVINLKSRPDRLKNIANQLDLMGVKWSRLNAVDGKTCTKSILEISNKEGEIGTLSDAVRGCTASHYKFWHKLIVSNVEFGIVLEDDVKLSDDFKEIVYDISWIPKDANLIKLEKFAANRPSKLLLGKTLTKLFNETREIRRMYSKHCGTGAYLMSQKAAKKAIDWKKPFSVPIDHVLFNETVSKLSSSLEPLIMVPPIAWQSDDIGQGSDIFQMDLKPISKFKKQLRSIKRSYYESRLWPYQLYILLIGKAKIISVNKK